MPAAGRGKTGMDGPGSATNLGAGRRITTGAGSILRGTAGAGIRALLECGTTGRRLWSGGLGSAEAAATDLDSATWVGCRSRPTRSIIRGGAGDTTVADSIAPTSTSRISM